MAGDDPEIPFWVYLILILATLALIIGYVLYG